MPETINANDEIRIKLKDHGREIWHEYWDGKLDHKIDRDGYLTIQIHKCMMIFGSHIQFHADGLPFATEIEVVARSRDIPYFLDDLTPEQRSVAERYGKQ